MNLLLKMIQTPYLLYMEDDWLALDHVSIKHVLDEALSVLRAAHKEEPVVEVLLNDQSSRKLCLRGRGGLPDDR